MVMCRTKSFYTQIEAFDELNELFRKMTEKYIMDKTLPKEISNAVKCKIKVGDEDTTVVSIIGTPDGKFDLYIMPLENSM